jgi:ABC-type uncharacterized transport system substrate-binding protein
MGMAGIPMRCKVVHRGARPFGLLSVAMAAFCLVAALVASPVPALAQDFVTTPRLKPGGGKWRIGYYEGGPYFNYRRNLVGFVEGLMDLGWIEPAEVPDIGVPDDNAALWPVLAATLKSRYVELVPGAFWSAGWNATRRDEVREDCIRRLNAGEVDFMLAAGTWAGQDLANDRHHVPLTVCAVSNAMFSGIVKSPTASGHDHVHAKCDPDRYVRMTRLFYNLFRFNRLGITYEDSPDGRVHGAVREIEQVSREFDFEVVRCIAPFSGVGLEAAEEAVINCQEKLARQVDAVIIPVHRGVNPRVMSRILAPYFERKIPTFSQQGSQEVKYGVLMGMTLGWGAFREVGTFHAKAAASAFNGVPVGRLPLIFEDPRGLALNRETARRLGYEVPPGLDLVAEDVFETIAPDSDK